MKWGEYKYEMLKKNIVYVCVNIEKIYKNIIFMSDFITKEKNDRKDNKNNNYWFLLRIITFKPFLCLSITVA